ncbi:MAG: hypothetical protein P4M14_11285 [Gammaproteobacteria bacterium]|nr:hypothetical protein [Gammaproteobacteria bacterium]
MKIVLAFLLLTISLPLIAHANDRSSLPKHLKIAIILRSSETAPYISSQYLNYYKQGLDTASYFAKTKGTAITYRFYIIRDISQLSQQMDEIKNWHPSFIIGPNYSNYFLLLKNYFSNILVLSANANDQRIALLPTNFYTLTPLNDEYALAVSNYIVEKFPSANIYTIVDRNCKACFDMADSFSRIFQSACPHKKIFTTYVFNSDFKETSVENLIPGYSKKDVVLMLATTNSSITLMLQIANYSNYPVTFIGDDTWGAAPDSQLGKLNSKNLYTAIHIIPWSLQLNTKQFALFKNNYETTFHMPPVDNITYTVFSTVNSVLYAVANCYGNKDNDIQERILSCYRQQLKNNAHAFRPELFTVEKVGASSNTLIGTVPSNKKYYCHRT